MRRQTVLTLSGKTRRLIVPAGLTMLIILLGLIVFLILRWPFRREAVLKELGEMSLSKVDADTFHGTYFPRPGCVLEHVTFQHDPKAAQPPLIAVERIRIEGTFTGLFTKHVKRVRADGMHILIPPRGTEHFEIPQRSSIVVDALISDGGILEVARAEDQQSLKFYFHDFVLRNVGANGPAAFRAKFSNPEPPGEITATGEFGPWSPNDIGKTAVSGEYSFQQADLGVFHGIAGLLSSSGTFSGELDHIQVHGQTDTPRFEVTSSSHQVQLRTQFHAMVNAENGDTFLQQVAATFWKTTVWWQGSVAGKSGQPGKTASVEFATKDGRIQDILLLFSKSKRASMSGITSFHAKASVPPGRRPFLEKVELLGDFGIDAGSFTNSETQEGVNHLSEGARGEADRSKTENNEDNPETVLSDLKGHVLLKDGTARFSNLSFSVPGASAQMQGTYNLISETIDLHGTLRTDSAPSNTTTGAKALFLKVLSPFLKKKVGYAMPVKITGTYDHPLFGLDLNDSRDKKRQNKNWRSLGLPTQEAR